MENIDRQSAPVNPGEVETLGLLDPVTLEMLNALVAQSGWNQTAADWQVFARHGSIHVIRDATQKIVASGACLPMGFSVGAGPATAVSWISMILVTPALRGTGLGRTIFHHCLQEVLRSGRIAMLDATPQGEKIYTKFGFQSLWRLTRWCREPIDGVTAPGIKAMPALTDLAELDAQALGFERKAVLAALLDRPDSRCERTPLGFALVRPGRLAHHVGPLLATDEEEAVRLLNQFLGSIAGSVFIDVPDDRTQVRAALQAAGFTPQRGFARMALAAPGQVVPLGHAGVIHAIAGPEFA